MNGWVKIYVILAKAKRIYAMVYIKTCITYCSNYMHLCGYGYIANILGSNDKFHLCGISAGFISDNFYVTESKK